MKKILAIIMTACLLCGAVALAETQITTNNGTATTKVSYTIETNESFAVTIPSSVNLTMTNDQFTGNLYVKLDASNFNVTGKTIVVRLTSAAFKLVNGSNEIHYTIDNGAISTNSPVLSWISVNTPYVVDKTMTINANVSAGLAAGTYADTLTFTAAVTETVSDSYTEEEDM